MILRTETVLSFRFLKIIIGLKQCDKTRVQVPAKIFPLGFDTKQRNSFLIKFGAFLQLKQDSDNIIHSEL